MSTDSSGSSLTTFRGMIGQLFKWLLVCAAGALVLTGCSYLLLWIIV